MSLYHARRGSYSNDTGKFRPQARIGGKKSAGGEYRGWYYDFVSHQSGSSVRRTSYSVSISDWQHNRVEYLCGFSSLDQASKAAQELIDQKLSRLTPTLPAGQVGSIPTVPGIAADQEK